MHPLFKTSLPSEFVDHKIFEEAKGLGTLVKASTFENSGRESNSQKFIEIDKKYNNHKRNNQHQFRLIVNSLTIIIPARSGSTRVKIKIFKK